ncbi:hypothetical protein SKAU_G00059910 [Synaphobranchus kaupii]|uniref:Uncharacterized protein n=1 Tax=Synaphobranchus kaupii TaxID=118154 RepID=A0A9Q1G5I5_SYNKA|nr:hypothetical protein SKAU_G00059910 [Synaphobranchus kaupii]
MDSVLGRDPSVSPVAVIETTTTTSTEEQTTKGSETPSTPAMSQTLSKPKPKKRKSESGPEWLQQYAEERRQDSKRKHRELMEGVKRHAQGVGRVPQDVAVGWQFIIHYGLHPARSVDPGIMHGPWPPYIDVNKLHLVVTSPAAKWKGIPSD